MTHVDYKKKDNYPHDRELLLFDRNAFQQIHRDVLREINERYNILCPQVFVMESLAPENTAKKPVEEFEQTKKSLREKLEMIENPIVLTGDTNTSGLIKIPPCIEYFSILTSEEIARNCILLTPITIKRVAPEKLISHYIPRINAFKNHVKTLTEACELDNGSLTTNRLISRAQSFFQRTFNMELSRKDIKGTIRRNEQICVTQEPNYVAKQALQTVESTTVNPPIERLKAFLNLTDGDIETLLNQIQDRRRFAPENYPNLAYPIYVYYLTLYIIYARQHDTQHIDQSYVRDFRYLHYLNFCDIFVSNETSTPYIVDSIPYDNIRETPVITVEELKRRLN